MVDAWNGQQLEADGRTAREALHELGDFLHWLVHPQSAGATTRWRADVSDSAPLEDAIRTSRWIPTASDW
jgi:hypothetical protein